MENVKIIANRKAVVGKAVILIQCPASSEPTSLTSTAVAVALLRDTGPGTFSQAGFHNGM